jgi:hypothetical protein
MTSCLPIGPNSRATPQRHLHCSLPAIVGLVITDEASPFALRSTRIRSEDSSAPEVPSRRRSRAAETMAPAFVPSTVPQGPLPEICQKLRYAQPRIAPRLDPRQRFSPARLHG